MDSMLEGLTSITMANIPRSGAVSNLVDGTGAKGVLDCLFDMGIATDLFSLG